MMGATAKASAPLPTLAQPYAAPQQPASPPAAVVFGTKLAQTRPFGVWVRERDARAGKAEAGMRVFKHTGCA